MEILTKERKIKEIKPAALRREGLIPGIVFSKKSSKGETETKPVSIKIDDFKKIYAEAGESTLVTLKPESNGTDPYQVLISDVQRHPISLEPIHASFYEVDLTEEITANVPIEIINDESHPLVKSGEGIVITVLSEIEVKCLPQNLPPAFEVDATALKEVGDVLTIADAIKIDTTKVELLAEQEEVIVKMDFAEQLEEEADEGSVDDVEVITGAKPDEDEAEGEETSEATTDSEE